MVLSYKDILGWWQSNTLNTIDDYKVILDNFQIIFATNTSNIEGTNISYHTTREVFEGDKLSGYSGSFESLYLIKNQKFAFEFILKSLINKTPITSDFIKKIHKILMYGGYDETRWNKGERPGTYKVNDYCVGVNDVGSLPEDVEIDINNLLDELNSTNVTDILKASAYFHAVFESIHPFADGNGRVGRTLLNYYLMQHNYPPMVIFDEDKETYYMALEVFNRTEEISGMVKFFEEQTIKTWENKMFKRRKERIKGNVTQIDVEYVSDMGGRSLPCRKYKVTLENGETQYLSDKVTNSAVYDLGLDVGCGVVLDGYGRLIEHSEPDFNPTTYISSKTNILLVPTASLAACRTKEDCDALLERLGIKI